MWDKAFNIEKIQNAMDINVELLQWSINFLIKKLLAEQLHINYTNQTLENLIKGKYTHHLYINSRCWSH